MSIVEFLVAILTTFFLVALWKASETAGVSRLPLVPILGLVVSFGGSGLLPTRTNGCQSSPI